ncbi:aspartate--tRNA(Asn) ligase [Spirochaeta africana]|uniref:Aspartate--tRNA(Asp/Asn) ligase n=1 Tax=Spirochaeta africana (strain ATCC 700263 / DSM 8902 / Z-7692) TaxID=889378 RepID=H9UMY1_SPIAZ|nr:aspartate--tRNA(Asn) ligase [Spirochaeta africana]AFG38874.1 aspartyl-tRNA synthetase, archaeal type [Spirochaeta africana DSM 8902]
MAKQKGTSARVLAAGLSRHAGETVSAAGWVHRIRELGGISFVLLRDRTGLMQLVYEGSVPAGLESVIRVDGTVTENDKAPGGYEIQVHATEVLGKAAGDLPLSVNQDLGQVGIDAVLDNRLLSLRNPKVLDIFRVQSTIAAGFAEYLRSQDFTEIKTSKLIGSGTEGGTGLFSVAYFDDTVFLAQSPQFYKQAMVASGLERVFEIGHAYRAEKHDTPRHLNEYVSLDVEMGFIGGIDDLMDLEVALLQHICSAVEREHHTVLQEYGIKVPDAAAWGRVPRISHEEAKKIAAGRSGKRYFEINPEAERELCSWAGEEYGIEAVFVTEYPRKKRPFYTYPEGLKTQSFDLLFRGLEITTGGRRIHDYAMLLENLPRFGLTEEGLGEYCKIFRYGCPPHGGFAIGLERLTQKLLGLDNIKEAALFPRDRKRITP